MKKTRKAWIQTARLVVQILIFAAILIAGISSKQISDWLLPTTLLIGVLFCGWICPLGALQDWAFKLGRLLKLPQFRMPDGIQRFLQISRYVFYFLLTMEIVVPVLRGTQNLSKIMHRQDVAVAAIVVLGAFILISLFFPRPFCNYFCTGGARRGLWSVVRLIGIRRDPERCVNCRQCSRNCPMHIDVANTDFVRHPNCVGCMTCMSVCPRDCISFKHMPPPPGRKGKK